MASRTINIVMDQGANYSRGFSPYPSPESSNIIDLDGNHFANAQIRQSAFHTDSVLTFTTQITHTGGPDLVTISANSVQTSQVKAGKYLYEIVLTDATLDGNPKTRIVEGLVTVSPSVEVGSMYTINSTGHDVRSSYT